MQGATPYLNAQPVPAHIRDLPLELAKAMANKPPVKFKPKREPKIFKARLP
jgi:hypothetical protein